MNIKFGKDKSPEIFSSIAKQAAEQIKSNLFCYRGNEEKW